MQFYPGGHFCTQDNFSPLKKHFNYEGMTNVIHTFYLKPFPVDFGAVPVVLKIITKTVNALM